MEFGVQSTEYGVQNRVLVDDWVDDWVDDRVEGCMIFTIQNSVLRTPYSVLFIRFSTRFSPLYSIPHSTP